jgi:AcrR family transcriptional regulator
LTGGLPRVTFLKYPTGWLTVPTAQRDSKRLIAEAARIEFADFGFDGARIDRIAGRAGVNKQLLYYYFGSKTGLYQDLIDMAFADLAADIGASGPMAHPAERLRTLLSELQERLRTRPELVRLLVANAQRKGRGAESAVRAVRWLVDLFAQEVSKGQGLGYFRDDVEPSGIAELTVAFLVGSTALEPAAPETASEVAHARWVRDAGDLIVRGLSW